MIISHRTLFFITLCFSLYASTGCKKFLTVDPPNNQLSAQYVFSHNQTAIEAVAGLYDTIMKNFGPANGFTSKYPALCADEIVRVFPSAPELSYSNNELYSEEDFNQQTWILSYSFIGQANAILENLKKYSGVSNDLKKELNGHAHFFRALFYFYLVNLYGGVPIVVSTDINATALLPRSSEDEVYQFIISDLLQAHEELSPEYLETGTMSGHVSANKWCASALLARTYLYRKEWEKSETYASEVINAGVYNLVTDPSKVFLAGSTEAILQLKPVDDGFNTAEGAFFVQSDFAHWPSYVLTASLDLAFENNDKRRTCWVKGKTIDNLPYHSPYKYRVFISTLPYTEYNMILRLAEQYLIRSEAAMEQQKYDEAVADLNIIRNRAGLPLFTTPMDHDQLFSAIEQERRIELFCEFGHRWFDLKRWPSLLSPDDATKRRADDVLGALKGSTWQPGDKLWPIPESEIQRNRHLDQNPGY